MVAVNATKLSQFKLEFIVLVVTRAGHLYIRRGVNS